jgi:hypothetical protein
MSFLVAPFCRVGYDDMASADEHRARLVQHAKKSRVEHPAVQIYVNGEVREV